LENRIATIASPVIQDLGFALVCVSIIGEMGSKNVRIMAEDPKTRNLGVDDAAKISRAVAAALDVEDPIDGRYRLEVSSPGIDRPLLKEQDFQDFSGHEAKIEIDMPLENGQRRFKGKIMGLKDGNILLATETGEVEIPFAATTKAKLVLTDELIKSKART
jgi:ribosome maturation factor RimP